MSDGPNGIRWRRIDAGGLEHLALKIADTGITAEGVGIAGTGPAGHAFRYRMVFDADWAGVRSLHLTLVGGATVALRHDGYGGWTDGEGKPRKDLAGAEDVDLSGSPIGLMAALHRRAPKAGSKGEMPVVRVEARDLTVGRATMGIVCLEAGRRFTVDRGTGPEPVEMAEDGVLAGWDGRFERLA